MEIFDRMVGVMTVMSMSGITETVITLNTPQFASSVFFGSQIIIQEYSTAPQAYNIQLNGSPQAVALFQGNADDLMAAFQAGNYNFRVNRLEAGHLTERPLFKRKEKAGGEKEAGRRTKMNPVIQQDLLRKVAAGRSETHEAQAAFPTIVLKKY